MIPKKSDVPISPEEAAVLAELADFKKMNGIRERVDKTVREHDDGRSAEAVVPAVLQTADVQRRISADVQSPERDAGRYQRTRRASSASRSNAVVANGVEYPVDCIIFATGFEVGTAWTRRAGYEITGQDGAR